MADKVVVFRYLYDSLKKMGNEELGAFMDAYMRYGFNGEETDLSKYPRADALYPVAKGLLDQYQKEDGRKCKEYREWRRSVLIRDNYTCQMCGETEKPLNAHHIMRYADHPQLRYDTDNGITLCEDCHKLVHWRERNV